MVRRRSASRSARDTASASGIVSEVPLQQQEIMKVNGDSSPMKKNKRSRRASQDSTISSPRNRSKKERGSSVEEDGPNPTKPRIIPLTGALKEAVLAAHKSGVELKRLKPEFHPDLKVETRGKAPQRGDGPTAQQVAESEAQRGLVTLQNMYLQLKAIATQQAGDVTRLQAENQKLNGALQQAVAQCRMYVHQLDQLKQQKVINQQQQQQQQGLASLLRGGPIAASLLQQLASAGGHPSTTLSPSQMRSFSGPTQSLFPVLRQDNFGESAQASQPQGNSSSLLDFLQQTMVGAGESGATSSPPPFTLPTIPEMKFDGRGQPQHHPPSTWQSNTSGSPVNEALAVGGGPDLRQALSGNSLNGSPMGSSQGSQHPNVQASVGSPPPNVGFSGLHDGLTQNEELNVEHPIQSSSVDGDDPYGEASSADESALHPMI